MITTFTGTKFGLHPDLPAAPTRQQPPQKLPIGITLIGQPKTYSMPPPAASPEIEYEGGLTDVDGIRVGHATDPRRPTGYTVVIV